MGTRAKDQAEDNGDGRGRGRKADQEGPADQGHRMMGGEEERIEHIHTTRERQTMDTVDFTLAMINEKKGGFK